VWASFCLALVESMLMLAGSVAYVATLLVLPLL
jgi:hypothetical protein